MSKKHYDSISINFEDNWFFTVDYFQTLTDFISENINLLSGDKFLDLGCGTGNYTKALINNINLEEVIGVDFSQEMINQFQMQNPELIGECSDLEAYVSKANVQFDKILLKEVIHHVTDYSIFFKNLSKVLFNLGTVTIVTRPKNTNFPFFQDALKKFSENQISENKLKNYMSQEGFRTSSQKYEIEITIEKTRLFKMIKNRFMSTFNYFTDAEIEQGLAEINERYPDTDNILFYDELIIINASKKGLY